MHIKTLIVESVDFQPAVESFPPEAHLDTMISISSHLSNVLFYKIIKIHHPFFYKYLTDRWEKRDMAIRVDMDGTDDYDKPQGTVNIYTKNISPRFAGDLKESLKKLIEYAKQYFEVGKVRFEGNKSENPDSDGKYKRAPFTKGTPLDQLGVIRLPLLKNIAAKYEAPPSLNVSNFNARTVEKILGYEDRNEEYSSGMIKLKDIPKTLLRLRNLSSGKLDALQRDDHVEKGPTHAVKNADGTTSIQAKGPTIYNMGLSRDAIDRYVGKLIEILQYCLDNKLDFSWG